MTLTMLELGKPRREGIAGRGITAQKPLDRQELRELFERAVGIGLPDLVEGWIDDIENSRAAAVK